MQTIQWTCCNLYYKWFTRKTAGKVQKNKLISWIVCLEARSPEYGSMNTSMKVHRNQDHPPERTTNQITTVPSALPLWSEKLFHADRWANSGIQIEFLSVTGLLARTPCKLWSASWSADNSPGKSLSADWICFLRKLHYPDYGFSSHSAPGSGIDLPADCPQRADNR